MAEPTTPGTPQVGRPEQPAAGAMTRLFRGLLAPVRLMRRRPARAALFLALFLLLIGLIAAGGAVVWFHYHLRLARAELAKGHNAVAIRHLHQCGILHPGHREVLVLSARAARRVGALEEADLLLSQYAERYGVEEPVVLERLLLQAAQGDLERVGPQLLARIRGGGPDAALAREALLTGLLYRFRWADAYSQLQDWLAHDPDSTTALLMRGKLEEQRQGVEVAIEHYRRILQIDPDHDEARLRLATQLLAIRRGEEALPHVEILRSHLPDHPEVAVQWVQTLALMGMTDKSRLALDECLKQHPDYAPALLERGSAKLLEGKEAEAESDIARAVQLDPGNLVARNQYAFALARNGKVAEAARARAEADRLKADLEQITTLIGGRLQNNANDPQVYYEIAAIALRSGLVAEAIRWFSSALRVDPNHVPSHRALASLYRELDNPILAARHRAMAQRHGEQPKP
jgi:tetratricopeptide (TPR) repeat protein